MNNNDVRTLLKIKQIPMWKVAEAIGISEATITRWFREPLTEEHYTKVINAVQAIEDVKSWVAVDGHEKHLQKDVIEWLKEFPSAQPERTCVNCGRTANNGGCYADGRTRCPIEEHYALPKDGFCYLWEKRNVTDDDYPERGTDEV